MRLGVQAAVVDGRIVPGDVELDRSSGTVASTGIGDGAAGGGLAVPGFVDLQINGIAGVTFLTTDAAGYSTVADALARTGVTAYQPSFITSPEDTMTRALRELADASRAGALGPRILGAHLEGPFLSPDRLGAHPAAHRRDPDTELVDRLLAAGPVGQMTLAPELPGALDVVDRLVNAGVTVSLGHTDATAVEAHAAFDRGATTVTHLFNAMRPPRHRDPGVAFAALARADVVVQLILDGVHLAAETAEVVWRAAHGRVALVTDRVASDTATRLDDGTLAGSALTMDAAMRALVALGAPVEDAATAASTVPARVARATPLGSLAPGAAADVVVLDDELRVRRTIVAAREIFAR